MNSHPNPVQPPRVAAWLLTLFAPTVEAESIAGDLLEEFPGLVFKSGVAVARRWYWRQTLRTVVQLVGAEICDAPWSMLVIVGVGFWLIGFATRFSVHETQTFLDAHRLYEWHPDAYLFWLKFPLQIGRVILCTAIGILVALPAKRKEMATVIALALIQIALFGAGTLTLIASGREWFHWFLVMMPWNCLCAIATIVGGAIVRTRRSAGPPRSTA